MGWGDWNTLHDGDKIFIDSNILTYHLLNHRIYGYASKKLIQEIQDKRYYGYITPIVVSETLFNFIKADIFKTFGIRPGEVAPWIKSHPEILAEMILDGPKELFSVFGLLPVGTAEVDEALRMVNEYALLTNDAFNAAVMKSNKITIIATNDNDFERVDGLRLWKPNQEA